MVLQIAWMYNSTKAQLTSVPSFANQWRGGQIPPDRPYCGFAGDRCVIATSNSAVTIAVVVVVLLILVASVVVLW